MSARTAPRRLRPRTLALVLAPLLLALCVASLMLGVSGTHGVDDALRCLGGELGLVEPLEEPARTILRWRLWRTLVAVGVGASLSLSGGLLQGVFRNDLASPSIVGVSAGAGLGASLVILVMGGYGPTFVLDHAGPLTPFLVTLGAGVGALGAVAVVGALATTGGRLSVPTLLLVGIAVNATAGGLLAALQSLVLRDYEVTRALFTWTFGTLDDRTGPHVAMVGLGTLLAASVVPFVSTELDLFAAGEDDARSLGVATRRVKVLAVGAAALAAAVAVAVAGQIAFVGLVVPHVLRLACGRGHRGLLPLCLLAGPVFLLGADVAQRALLDGRALQPGAVMSLVGGPFFLFLLVRNRREIQAW